MINTMLRARTDKATAALPASTVASLFTITGGRVVMSQIIGEVTTVIQTQANNTKLQLVPSSGTTVDLCAVLDITADEVGTLYGITGTAANAMVGAGQVLPGQAVNVILKPGILKLNCAATNTGSVKWTIYWAPLDGGAYVTSN